MSRPAVESDAVPRPPAPDRGVRRARLAAQRCVRIQAIIAGAGSGRLGARDTRRLARARLALPALPPPGARRRVVDPAAVAPPAAARPRDEKVAALFPIPLFFRGRRGGSRATRGSAQLSIVRRPRPSPAGRSSPPWPRSSWRASPPASAPQVGPWERDGALGGQARRGRARPRSPAPRRRSPASTGRASGADQRTARRPAAARTARAPRHRHHAQVRPARGPAQAPGKAPAAVGLWRRRRQQRAARPSGRPAGRRHGRRRTCSAPVGSCRGSSGPGQADPAGRRRLGAVGGRRRFDRPSCRQKAGEPIAPPVRSVVDRAAKTVGGRVPSSTDRQRRLSTQDDASWRRSPTPACTPSARSSTTRHPDLVDDVRRADRGHRAPRPGGLGAATRRSASTRPSRRW